MAAACQRPVRFVMHYSFYKIPIVRTIFKIGGVIPIAQEKEDPEMKKQAFAEMEKALEGAISYAYSEDGISQDGQMAPFRRLRKSSGKKCPFPSIH